MSKEQYESIQTGVDLFTFIAYWYDGPPPLTWIKEILYAIERIDLVKVIEQMDPKVTAPRVGDDRGGVCCQTSHGKNEANC